MNSEKAAQFTNTLTEVFMNSDGFPVKVFLTICKECGAVVLFETRELHLEWHHKVNNYSFTYLTGSDGRKDFQK